MEKFCWKRLFWQSFVKNSWCVFSRSKIILATSQEWLVWLMWNENEVHWLDTGYNMWTWPLTSLMTLTMDVPRTNFEIAVGLIDVKWKGSELIGYWADYMTLPFDHTHDLDLRVSRTEPEIALSQEWDSWLTWKEKDGSHPFTTMILTSVAMVGWAVAGSDGVTSDVGVPSTYLVVQLVFFFWDAFISVVQRKPYRIYSCFKWVVNIYRLLT